MRSRVWITLVVTTALFLSSPGAAAEPSPTLPPSWVAVEPGSTTTISWGAPADGGSGVSHYVVYRGGAWVADISGFSWVDPTPDGTPYSVAAMGSSGESVAVVGVPASADCVAWVEGLPPIMVDVWECIDPAGAVDLLTGVAAGTAPGKFLLGLRPLPD